MLVHSIHTSTSPNSSLVDRYVNNKGMAGRQTSVPRRRVDVVCETFPVYVVGD